MQRRAQFYLAVKSLLLFVCSNGLGQTPNNFFNGGSRVVDEGPLRAGTITGVVVDNSNRPLTSARVQILGGSTKRVFHDIRTGEKGRFDIPRLKPGKYRMGISSPGFNLHLWDLEIVTRGVSRTLRVQLSLGT